MFVKPRTTRWFVEYVGGSGIYTTKPTGAAYRTIKAISEQLRGALQEYQSHDMVDIQSFIWVCRPEYQNTGDEEEVLARPFSQIFVDRTEAEWAFDFLRETLERLGVTRADDERFAITLPGKNILRLNFGVWAIVSFYELTHLPNRIHVDLITDGLNLEKHSYKQWGTFARNDDEPEISGFELPLEAIKTTSDDLLKTFEKTLDHIAVKFQNYTRCPWRSRHHVSQIAEAVFDPKKRNDLFSEGLTEEMLEIVQVDGADTVESLSLEEQINPLYPLPQLATDTGFAEAELARWVRAIERKKQAILYGPPGTGKTYLAEKLAEHLIGGEDGFRELVQFHPAYAYEDFIQGIRPRSEGDHLSYPLVPGRLLEFCRRAQARQGRCVLIIDEINRANLARVFGELMYLLEYRDREMPLAQGGTLRLPSNVRLIGTMNTADRSIALVDHALRRRFAFIALSPNYDVLRHYHERHQTGFSVDGLINVLKRLNTAIDDPHYAVGMTFFFHKDLQDQLEDIWRMEIEPYLEEYFFDQPSQVDEFRWAEIGPQVLP